ISPGSRIPRCTSARSRESRAGAMAPRQKSPMSPRFSSAPRRPGSPRRRLPWMAARHFEAPRPALNAGADRMRTNTLKQKLRDGKPAFGAMITFPSPPIVEMLGYMGFDWVLIDNEHGSIGVD